MLKKIDGWWLVIQIETGVDGWFKLKLWIRKKPIRSKRTNPINTEIEFF